MVKSFALLTHFFAWWRSAENGIVAKYGVPDDSGSFRADRKRCQLGNLCGSIWISTRSQAKQEVMLSFCCGLKWVNLGMDFESPRMLAMYDFLNV